MASETMTLAESAEAGHFVAFMTKEIFGLKTVPRVLDNFVCKRFAVQTVLQSREFVIQINFEHDTIVDKKSLKEHLKSSNVIQDRRLRVDIARVREILKLGIIEVHWVDKTYQLADPLKKYDVSAVRVMGVLK